MPRIQMTRSVRFALWFLRIYLLVLLSSIGLRFVRGFSDMKKEAEPPKSPVTGATNRPAAK